MENACAMLVNPLCQVVSATFLVTSTLTQDLVCHGKCLRHVSESPLPGGLGHFFGNFRQVEGEPLEIDCWLDGGAAGSIVQFDQLSISKQSDTHFDCWSSEILCFVFFCEVHGKTTHNLVTFCPQRTTRVQSNYQILLCDANFIPHACLCVAFILFETLWRSWFRTFTLTTNWNNNLLHALCDSTTACH